LDETNKEQALAVKIRLVRLGKIRTPHYRIVVADSRKARNGLKIEEIGRYSPASDPSLIQVDSDRAQHWLKQGAQPTEAVAALLKITGDWQKFKGISGSEGTLKTIPARPETRAKRRRNNYEETCCREISGEERTCRSLN
jgi:small subunit ribosomal protein S16